ncbi:hypothetical protein AB0F81_29395 [Actinoplanes sp. NPDC024001]|uniref:hypothetical protein n=1 Tax=Actinoplanes sp. NPDC024001 TaxID=3154598 RepID=UPI0033EF11A7
MINSVVRRDLTGTVAVAGLSVAAYAVWLGGALPGSPAAGSSEPYPAWQVAGAAVTLIAVLVAAIRLGVRPIPAAAALTVAFTAAWTVPAAASDDTGLYAIGAILLLVGLTAATAVVATVAAAWNSRRSAAR